jgi:uncharacterized protein YcbX
MHLSEINIYPIKSLGGIALNRSLIEEPGLRFDRRWLLIDEKNKFLTQRDFPQMAKFGLTLENENLTISFENEKLSIPFDTNRAGSGSIKIWSSAVKAEIYDDEINRWFSERFNSPCRLAFMNGKSKRKVSPFYAVRKFRDTVSFADAYPFLIAGENSLKDLNEKMEKPLPMNRFRPNLVIAGSEAFAEDGWKKIKIGKTVFHVVKACARCSMTTIDQKTGEKDGAEPLKTLAGFRKKSGNVFFGQYLIADKAGEIIEISDKVEILEVKN